MPGLFYRALSDGGEFEVENLLPIDEPMNKREYRWAPTRPLRYKSEDGKNLCHGAVTVGQRPLKMNIHPDRDPEEWAQYYDRPMELLITLKYRLEGTQD